MCQSGKGNKNRELWWFIKTGSAKSEHLIKSVGRREITNPMVVKKLICGTVLSHRQNSFIQAGWRNNESKKFLLTIRNVRMQVIVGCSSAAYSCHPWPKTSSFASPSSVYSLWSQKECCISRYHIHAHPHLIILPKKKTSLHPLPTTITTRWLSSLWKQNCVTGPCQVARKVSTLWWKVTRDKLSANSLNHLVNILYWLCGRVRTFGLSEYSKCAASFSLFVIMGEWNKNDFLSSQSLISKLSRKVEVIFNC